MKNYIIIHILLFLLFMLAYQCSSAQNDFLVTNLGDTVRGEIKLLFYAPEKKVQVKTEDGKKIFSMLNTKEFRYNDEVYQPAKGPYGYTFMKLLKPGYLSLYAFQLDNSAMFDGRFLQKADGDGIELPNLGFKKQLERFLADCDEVSRKIDEDIYGRKDLDAIIDEYNKCITEKTVQVKKVIATQEKTTEMANSWDVLTETINQHDDFEGKATALEITADIRNRIRRGEKIPNFVIDGLKNSLAGQEGLTKALINALSDIGY